MQYRTLTHKGGRILVASYRKIFCVLFLGLLVGCVKVSVSCNIDNIDMNNKRAALEECKENPNLGISKEF